MRIGDTKSTDVLGPWVKDAAAQIDELLRQFKKPDGEPLTIVERAWAAAFAAAVLAKQGENIANN